MRTALFGAEVGTMDQAWADTYDNVITYGHACKPRGKAISELLHHTIAVDMQYPVLRLPERKLNYKFMAAEAAWILSGSNQLSEITPYNKRLAEFSDDGQTLYGAYGPRIVNQLDHVVRKLVEDRDTRQATMTTWIQNPQPTKDVPCTVALDFKIREDRLNVHVFMRSSDVWLGLPYDVFTFTCVGLLVREVYNTWTASATPIGVGNLYLTAASSHIYQDHWDALSMPIAEVPGGLPLPIEKIDLYGIGHWLDRLKQTSKGDPMRWWETGL
jgi:thymidylate synthase